MAQIILNVNADIKLAQTQLKALEATITGIGQAMSKVSVNKDLTAQIKALTDNYRALASAAKAAESAENTHQKRLTEEAKQARLAAAAEKDLSAARKNDAIAAREETTAVKNLSTANLQDEKAAKMRRDAVNQSAEASEKHTSALRKATAASDGHSQSLLTMIPQIIKWNIAMTAVMAPLRMIQSALDSFDDTLVRTEDSVIAIRRVVGEIPAGEISDRIYDIAQRYGQTYENVSEIVTNFARSGLDWSESLKAAESAVLALNVAELDATATSEGLLAIISQFKLEVSDLPLVVDMLNKTSDNYRVTTEKLLKALQRTGSSAKNARLELADTIGIITGLSASTNRSGENLGTAVNALIQYSTKGKALDIFASLSEETEKVVDQYKMGASTILDVWKAVSDVINNANERQKEILSDLANQEEVTDLASELHDELGDIFEQTEEIYGTANTFRKNYFISLLANMDTVMKSIDAAGDAAGYSEKENEQYLDTYTAKVNTLNATWEEVANNEQGVLGMKKVLVESGTVILNLVQWTGGLKTSLSLAATAAMVFAGPQIISGITKLGAGIKSVSLNTLNLTTNLAAYKMKTAEAASQQEYANVMTERAAAIQRELNLARMNGTATEEMQTAATEAQTAATNAQTAATEAQAAAQSALNLTIAGFISVAGIALTAGLALYGISQRIAEEQRRERQETIENFNAKYEESVKIAELYGRYEQLLGITERTTEQNEDLKSVEEELIQVLGTKSKKLEDLKKGTDEYREALKKLTNEEISERAKDAAAAKIAADHEYRSFEGDSDLSYNDPKKWWIFDIDPSHTRASTEIAAKIQKLRSAEGYDERFHTDSGYTLPDFETAIERYEYLDRFESWLYNKDFQNSDLFLSVNNAVKEAKTASEEYLKVITEAEVLGKYVKNDFKMTSDELDGIVESIVEANGITGNYLTDYVRDIAESTVVINGETEGFGKNLDDAAESAEKLVITVNGMVKTFESLEDANDYITKTLEKENELRKQNAEIESRQLKVREKALEVEKAKAALAEKESDAYRDAELEEHRLKVAEKSLEVEKARRSLEDAKNQQNVRVLNAETGAYEWQADVREVTRAEENLAKAQKEQVDAAQTLINQQEKIEKEIEKAREDLVKAQSGYNSELVSLSSWLKDKAFEEIKTILQDGKPVTSDELNGIFDKWLSYSNGATAPEEEDIYKLALRVLGFGKASGAAGGGYAPGIKADSRVATYDSGGILHGTGGIKATSADETVLDPDITAKLLSPVSNERFASFSKSLGILFGASERANYSRAQMINNARTTNDSHDTTNYFNGIPVPADAAERYSMAQIAQMMDVV